MSSTVALMWDCNGLEAAVNVTDINKRRVWATLKGEDASKIPFEPNLMHWRLRAQANMQRHYEIYLVEIDDSITVDDICEAFESNPQHMAETVRRIGHKFYSDRVREDAVKIK
jgi:cytidylate kinase